MRFKLDENLSPTVAALLLEAGHDTATVAEQGLAGAEDHDIASVCLDEGRILLTVVKKVNFSRNGPSTTSEVRVKRTAAPTAQGGSALESHQGTPS